MREGITLVPIEYHQTVNQLVCLDERYNLDRLLITGSRTMERYDEESDIDIIIVIQDEKDRRKIIEDVLRITKGNPLWDIKIVTTDELKKIWQGRSHFQIHLMIKQSVPIINNQSIGSFPLRIELLANNMSNDIREIEENLELLEDKSQFSRCAISIISCIKTVFFIEKYILENSKVALHSFTRKMLGSGFEKVNHLYNSLSHSNRKEMKFTTTISIPPSLDKKQNVEDYQNLIEASMKLLDRCRGIKKALDAHY